jgi:CubicO group peptidase (beta-lactamase class C family)
MSAAQIVATPPGHMEIGMASNAFDGLHAAMRDQVDRQFLPGVSTALLRGREVVDRFCYGQADREAGIPLREDHVFRVYSNTKLVTSCAALLLLEEGRYRLDDPVEAYLPELGRRRVLRPDARTIDDTEPANDPITVRHLMTHTAGLSYGIFDAGTLIFDAYQRADVMNPARSLAQKVEAIATLPLAFHPGTRWEYSVATDVVARLVEVLSGERFGAFLARRIFEPLGMVDTDFWVPPDKVERFCALYVGVDPLDPTRPGLTRLDDTPCPGAYLTRVPAESGGGGLVSTLGDMVRLLQSLMPGGPTLLRPETIALMGRNHLPDGLSVRFTNMPPLVGRGFGLGSGVVLAPGPVDPAAIAGEVYWGGMAGTIWWINPRLNLAGALMTQRYMGTGNPYSILFKQQAYKGLLG